MLSRQHIQLNFLHQKWSEKLRCAALFIFNTGLKKAGGLSEIFLFDPCCGRLRATQCTVEAGEDDEEPKTINHGWCHPPQSLWPAPP